MVALTEIPSHSQIGIEHFVLSDDYDTSDVEFLYEKKCSEMNLANGSIIEKKLAPIAKEKLSDHCQSQCQIYQDSQYAVPASSIEKMTPKSEKSSEIQECPLFAAFLTFVSLGVLLFLGYIKDFFYPPSVDEKNREGYVPLFVGFESFFMRHFYRRVQGCWNSPICSTPGSRIELLERYSPDYGWTMKITGKRETCLNVGSYNYLGFAQNYGPCYDDVVIATKKLGITTSSPRLELGSLKIHKQLESHMAEFLKVDDVIVFGMGFATNTLNIPSLFGPGCLILSDEFNHASLILGIKVSGATVKVFQHNNMKDLERLLRHNVIHGHPRTRRAWRKVAIVVEGIYSMEGTICNLPELVALKKRYKAYLYVDEAHSIGALGPNGGGVVDYYGADPKDVDILMGTFTKSFGGAGGYIAGSKDLINYLRVKSDAQSYAASMPPPVAQQIMSTLSIIMGKDGTNEGQRRIVQLTRNSRYFRRRVKAMGCVVLGNHYPPIVPLFLFVPAKAVVFFHELRKRGVAGVCVGFPATKLTGARMRFCLSAAHTKEDLDHILQAVDEVADLVACKYSSCPRKKEVIDW